MERHHGERDDYPLAVAYDWSLPKRDTGGIFYLYPPHTSITHKHCTGVDLDFVCMKRQRIYALNPREHFITYTEEGLPRFANGSKHLV